MVGICVLGLAGDAMQDNRLTDSEKLFKEAIELIESPRGYMRRDLYNFPTMATVPPSRSQVAIAYNNQGILLKREKKLPEAEASFKHAIDLYEHDYGKSSPHLCNTLVNLAATYTLTGNIKESENVAHRALTIMKGVDPATPLYQQVLDLIAEDERLEKPRK